jgi:hypothetical protein
MLLVAFMLSFFFDTEHAANTVLRNISGLVPDFTV